MKALILKVLQGLFSSPQFAVKFKDTALTNGAEHLVRTVNYIDKKGLSLFGRLIVDIGAAEGDTSVYFSQLYPEHTVHGFEPAKKHFEIAEKKTSAMENIVMHKLALSDREGKTKLHVTESSLSSSTLKPDEKELSSADPRHAAKLQIAHEEEVQMQTLDAALDDPQPILLMKIDTQGTELNVLKGATQTLRRTKLVLVEMNNHRQYEGNCQYYEVDELLRKEGFVLKDIFVTYRSGNEMSEYDALYENPVI
jgi:FkbM family methyltransferase